MAARSLDIPLELWDWKELNRRCSQLSQDALSARDALRAFVGIGYGGLILSAPTAGADIGAGWETVPFDATTIATPAGVIQNVANNTLTITREGVWAFTTSFAFEHNELNAGRTTNARVFNVTDGTVAGLTVVIPTGRNQLATTFAITNLVEIGAANLGDELRIEIGGGDSYTGITWDAATWNIFSVGEWRGTL